MGVWIATLWKERFEVWEAKVPNGLGRSGPCRWLGTAGGLGEGQPCSYLTGLFPTTI